jgi:HNH endonuclease
MDERLSQLVWSRAGGRCEYCLLPQSRTTLSHEIDHVIAIKHGGQSTASNLALACFACNHHKGPNIAGIDPVTRTVIPLFHPRRHKWLRHFLWAGAVLVGRTPVGRATIAVLEINLSYRVDMRGALMTEGVFFP